MPWIAHGKFQKPADILVEVKVAPIAQLHDGGGGDGLGDGGDMEQGLIRGEWDPLRHVRHPVSVLPDQLVPLRNAGGKARHVLSRHPARNGGCAKPVPGRRELPTVDRGGGIE